MNIQTTKLELIKMIADVQSEQLLNTLVQLLKKDSKQVVPSLSEQESALLLKINEGLPTEIQARYNELSLKSVQKKLTNKEHQELLAIIPQVEAKTVERLKYLIELAQLWNMTVDAVMEKLELQTPPVIHV